MKNKVRIIGIQTEPVLFDKESNINRVESMLESNNWFKPDLIVLPEVFDTGIFPPEDSPTESEKIPGLISRKLTEWAQKYECYIHGGSIIEACEDGKYRNNSLLLDPSGEIIASYYKQHMFSHFGSREGEFVTPGTETVVVQTEIGKIGMSVCYDLRFPEIYRALADNGAEIITVPAAWPFPRLLHWLNLNKARAIENQCFVIAVNQVGKVPPKRTNVGNSMVIDPWGSVIASAGEKEAAMLAEIDLDEVHKLRKVFPIANDRNYEAYKNVKVY